MRSRLVNHAGGDRDCLRDEWLDTLNDGTMKNSFSAEVSRINL